MIPTSFARRMQFKKKIHHLITFAATNPLVQCHVNNMHVIEARLRFVQPNKICICVAHKQVHASYHSHRSYRICTSQSVWWQTQYMNIEWRLGREIMEQPHVRYNTLWKWEICICRSENDYSLVTTPAPAPNNCNTQTHNTSLVLSAVVQRSMENGSTNF